MKKFLMVITIVISMVALSGCGSSDSGKVYNTSAPAVKAGTSITMTSDGDANLNYSYADNGSIIVGSDNGDVNLVQGDGNINVVNNNATQIEDGSYINAAGTATCASGAQGSCPDGMFFCPIEGKCVPSH